MENADLVCVYFQCCTSKLNDKNTPIEIEEIVRILQKLTEKCQGLGQEDDEGQGPQKFRNEFPYQLLQEIAGFSKNFSEDPAFRKSRYQYYSHLFRFGRNVVVNCKRNQEFVVKSDLIYLPIKFLSDEISAKTSMDIETTSSTSTTIEEDGDFGDPSLQSLQCTRLALQMIYNCMTTSSEIARELVVEYNLNELLISIASLFDDEVTLKYCSITGFAISGLLGPDMPIPSLPSVQIEALLDKLDNHSFLQPWISTLLTSQFTDSCYLDLEESFLARVLTAIIDNNLSAKLSYKAIESLANLFQAKVKKILSVELNSVEKLISTELGCIVKIFCNAFEDFGSDKMDSDKIKSILSNSDFVFSANSLLKMVHMAGKLLENNSLTPLETLDSLARLKNEVDQSHPTYLFKSNLIRLVGTISHKNKVNQTMARELDTLSIILECTKIDARNPFIPQCAIFAIRCLLEDNAENQEFVGNVSKF